MQTIREIDALRRVVAAIRRDGGSVALVPTMGALHSGHMALISEAKRHGSHVAASIFVNPTQFAPTEDLASYPRREAADEALLEAAGCAFLWAPSVATMYPDGYATTISVSGVSEAFEGAHRPGHFGGVATVVAKLFGQVRPDVVLFGEKDFQQLAVIRKMVRDLDLDVRIVGVPTQRDADGLALSSRNAYLSEEERIAARVLPRVLLEAAQAIREGADMDEALERARSALRAAGFDPIDYVALADAETLTPLDGLDRPARLLAAAKLGRTRLIDNVAVEPL
nr:pantoate--beta-alanine ligase [uncultured Sphingosinicella sp.]